MKIGLKYVVRSGRHYHFRFTVPQDVRPFIGRREIKKSLQTDDWREAGVRAKQIACRTLELVRNLRKHMLNAKQRDNKEQLIREVVKRALDDSLRADEQWRLHREATSEEDADLEINRLKEALERERSALARNDLTGIYDHVVRYLTDFDYLDELGHPVDLAKLCRESLKAYIVQLQVELARAQGDYENPYDGVTAESFSGART
ncbi:MAG: hypothetical protein HN976_07755, partial [Lentisphaerae bacterium]|nr:hypothetical protein [Lentisphaerota bacterium]